MDASQIDEMIKVIGCKPGSIPRIKNNLGFEATPKQKQWRVQNTPQTKDWSQVLRFRLHRVLKNLMALAQSEILVRESKKKSND
eukprot:TRINITY_DN4750_c0_g1_i1.p1 TRINITY_DN4750_c0_g1~~TRINITY_DN4750_c0_g1_i1.p1  ORF type:complete len:84 (-),score=15.49 TRINITY_DN4750_c0_g1_i1:44-295(-)